MIMHILLKKENYCSEYNRRVSPIVIGIFTEKELAEQSLIIEKENYKNSRQYESDFFNYKIGEFTYDPDESFCILSVECNQIINLHELI